MPTTHALIELTTLVSLTGAIVTGADLSQGVFRVVAECEQSRGGRSAGTAFLVQPGQMGIRQLHFITALHVVNGCREIRIVLNDLGGDPPPVSTVPVRLSFVDVRNDLAALTVSAPGGHVQTYLNRAPQFQLASRPESDTEDVVVHYYSVNNPLHRDTVQTTVTTRPLKLRDITENTTFPWDDLVRLKNPFLDTEVLRLPAIAWKGFSGAPVLRANSPSIVLGIVDGGIHESRQWATAAWLVSWTDPNQNQRIGQQMRQLLEVLHRVQLLSDTPTLEVTTPAGDLRFIGVSGKLIDDQTSLTDDLSLAALRRFFVFIQESELSNGHARAIGLTVRDATDPSAPFVTARQSDASKACRMLGGELLSSQAFRRLLLEVVHDDPQLCFANVGFTAAQRGCVNSASDSGRSFELDTSASLRYVAVDRFPSKLGFRNLIGNAWEWTRDGVLAGGAVDTFVDVKRRHRGRNEHNVPADASSVVDQLFRPRGEGAVRCAIQ